MSEYRFEDREPNFEPRTETAGPFEVRFRRVGQLPDGEPWMQAAIYRDGRRVTVCDLNWTTLCQPGYSVNGLGATAAEVVHAVLGDEHIFTGEPSFPGEHDTAVTL